MAVHRLLGDLGEADAFDAGRGAGEIAGDELGREADGVENLRAAIGLIGRDAHLGHHLEHALADRLDVALDDFLVVELLRQVALHGDQRLEGEIGVDRLGAVAGEAAEMMHLARLAGLDDEADRGAQALADQVMMHAARREQRRDRHAVGAGAAVGQDDDVDAVVHRDLGLGAQLRRARPPCPRRRCRPRVGDVERLATGTDCRRSSPMARIFSRSSLVRIGWRTSRRLRFAVPLRSNRFGRGPMNETRLITSSSRIGSIGGLVTCAKFCLK